jgi:hypothetical protein
MIDPNQATAEAEETLVAAGRRLNEFLEQLDVSDSGFDEDLEALAYAVEAATGLADRQRGLMVAELRVQRAPFSWTEPR